MLPNRESGPQNQPNANVAVSVLAGADTSIGGIVTVRIASGIAGSAVFPSLAERKRIAPITTPTRQTPTKIHRVGGIPLPKRVIFCISTNHKFFYLRTNF
jgi:hypothetical protein